MIPGYLSPIANHLWQSTIFAAAAGLLTLTLRNNRAAVRYGLWLAASAKFLIPFSLLVGIGSRFEWHSAVAIATPGWSGAIDDVIAPPVFQVATGRAMTSTTSMISPILALIFAIWALGFIAVLYSWWRGWQPTRKALRRATPLHLSAPSLANFLDVRSSPELLEPAVVGVRRPVLLLPYGITDHLQEAELQAVFAHELCHIRRRDNLAAMMHMLVEALFWFHPLVWWLEARLVNERERACDEEVLRSGNDPTVYAESILKICRLYVHSQIACAASVSGANLAKRLEDIMVNRVLIRMSLCKKALLATVAVGAVALPLVAGFLISHEATAQTQSTSSGADAQSKPDPEREALLRREIADEQNGDVDVAIRSPALADAAKKQWPIIQATNKELGKFVSLTFQRIDERGFDVFTVSYENGRMSYFVGPLTPDHKLNAIYAQRIPSSAEEDAVKQHIADGKPDAERAALMRQELDKSSRGDLDTTILSPRAAIAFTQGWKWIQEANRQAGKFQSITFQRIDQRGFDIYTVTYEHERKTYMVGPLTADHKLDVLELLETPSPEEQTATRQHIAAGKADPERETLLRREITAEQKGEIDPDFLSPRLGGATERQWFGIEEINRQMGKFVSLAFQRVDERGFDVYSVSYENGNRTYLVGPLTAFHKLNALFSFVEDATTKQRIAEGKLDPERETLLRRFIAAEQKGQVDVAIMTPGLAAATQQQWAETQERIRSLGKFLSLAFQRVDERGWDVYGAAYESGRRTFFVGPLSADHKLQGLGAQTDAVM